MPWQRFSSSRRRHLAIGGNAGGRHVGLRAIPETCEHATKPVALTPSASIGSGGAPVDELRLQRCRPLAASLQTVECFEALLRLSLQHVSALPRRFSCDKPLQGHLLDMK